MATLEDGCLRGLFMVQVLYHKHWVAGVSCLRHDKMLNFVILRTFHAPRKL